MKCFCHYFSLRVFFNFFTSSLLTYFAKEAPVRGVFVFFFYLHADEQGVTRSSFHSQSTFPPWPRGKGNCLPDCPHRLTLILDGWSTGQVHLRVW